MINRQRTHNLKLKPMHKVKNIKIKSKIKLNKKINLKIIQKKKN